VKSREGGPRSAEHFHDAYKIARDISGQLFCSMTFALVRAYVGAYRKFAISKEKHAVGVRIWSIDENSTRYTRRCL
jgi:hypothetical protein